MSGNLSNLYVDDGKENRRRISISILYLVFYNLQKSNRGFIKLKKQSHYNDPTFYFLIRLEYMKNQR